MVYQYYVCKQKTTRLIKTIVCLMIRTLVKSTSWKNMRKNTNVKKQGLLKILDGTFLHSKCSSLRTSCFIPHQKAPSLKTSPIHQFTFEVNQFCVLWHVDLSQWSHGTKRFFSERVPK
jgi:hypothetical protein